jgi:hypothetical protein
MVVLIVIVIVIVSIVTVSIVIVVSIGVACFFWSSLSCWKYDHEYNVPYSMIMIVSFRNFWLVEYLFLMWSFENEDCDIDIAIEQLLRCCVRIDTAAW